MGTAKRHTGNQQQVVPVHDWDALADLLKDLKYGDEVVPVGWYRTKEWAKIWGLSESRTAVYLRIGVDAGKIESREFRVGNRPKPHYRKAVK